jgi:DUF177 domain-containing protein
MPVTVNLRHLEDRNVQLNGELPVGELDLDLRDEIVRAEKPLRYDLEIQMFEKSLLVQGRLELRLQCQCVRCLKSFECALELDNWTCHVPLEGDERAVVANDCVDLTPYLREDILLEFPQHPLCEPDCGGLPGGGKAKKAKDANQPGKAASAWAELDKLKL